MRNTLLTILAWALSYASIAIIVSLPYTSYAMASTSGDAELHQNEGAGETKNNNKQQHQQTQDRRMQVLMNGESAQEAPVGMPLPPSTTESPGGTLIQTTEVEYSPIYNTRMKTCTGFEAEGLKGYRTLDDLRDDLQLYFYDMNGYSYHRSAEDIAAAAMTESPTGHPSASPSVSFKPTIASSNVPSSIPTQQPVTPAPTDFPTSSLRLPQDPTKSPSPTISPRITPGTGVVTDIVDEVDGTFSPTVLILGLRTGSPSRTPTLRPVEEDGNRIVERSDRKRVREHIDVEVGSVRRRLQEETTTDALFVEVMSDTGVPELDEIVTLSDGEEVLIPVTNSSEESSAAAAAAGTEEEEGGIHFHICPDTNFQFNSILVAQLKFLPLVVESPVQKPLTLACLKDNACTFNGGNFHIVFNNNGLEEDILEESSMDQEHSTITVSGINFQESAEASIVMNDPQGTIIFDKCKWENNEGEAIVVDGRYTGNNLEREYYGVDDYMLPPGGVNPYASTDPTVPASTTEFSFVTTTDSAVITTKFTDVVTTETPPTLDVGSESFRLLEETSVVDPKPKSSILIRKSTFTGNKGDATIAVESYSEDEGLESGTSSTSSINLAIEKSTFSSERVGSVILASGAKVSSKGNLFEKNIATSMIQIYSGTIAITETKFEDNVISGGDGLVEVDEDSKVGDTNCVEESGDGVTATVGLDTTESSDVCEGTFDIENDICKPFGQVCDPEATPETLSLREGVREGASSVGIGIASVSAPQSPAINTVSNNSSGSEEAKTVTLERRKSKSSKSTKPAKPQAQQQQQGSNGRNQKDKDKGSKSSKPKKGGGRKRKRGKR